MNNLDDVNVKYFNYIKEEDITRLSFLELQEFDPVTFW